jgi:NAD(P)-dependent dehydrogenase (short-subunit alcohol dehydrogenase family)
LDEVRSQCGSEVNVVVNCAGIAPPMKVVGRSGPHSLEAFSKVLTVNTVGSFNVIRLAAARMMLNSPDSNGERGVVVNTARSLSLSTVHTHTHTLSLSRFLHSTLWSVRTYTHVL